MLCLSALILLTGITGCKDKTSEKKEMVRYKVTTPFLSDTSITKEYVAQIQSVRNIEIRAQEKGYLESVFVDEGQFVKAGQRLFRIMPRLYEAEYLKATARVKEAELELLNTSTLAEKNIVSKTEQAIAQAKLDEAKAEQSLAHLHVSFTDIRAPFDGVIDRIPFKLGSLIEEGAALTTLSDNRDVYAYFNVSESEYLDYKTGNHSKEPVGLLLANNREHTAPGFIETIEGVFDNSTGNIAFRARFPNPGYLLKHGETGKVRMTVPLTGALLIPQKSTYELQDKIYVYVISPDGVVSSRNIRIRARMPDIYVVESGLDPKDLILIEGVQNVKDDDKISFEKIPNASVISGLQLIQQPALSH